MHQRLSALIALYAAAAAVAPSVTRKPTDCIDEFQIALCDVSGPHARQRSYKKRDALIARSTAWKLYKEMNSVDGPGSKMPFPTTHEGNYPGYQSPFLEFPISNGEVMTHCIYSTKPFCDFVVLDRQWNFAAILNGRTRKPCPIINQTELLGQP